MTSVTNEKKPFRLKADAVFYAENIDEAFDQLMEHFRCLRDSEDYNLLDFTGSIEIKEVTEWTPTSRK